MYKPPQQQDEKKPSLQSLLAMYSQFSPEANVSGQLHQQLLGERTSEGQFAQSQGAPTLPALQYQANEPNKQMSALALKQAMEQRDAESGYAKEHGAPSMNVLKLQQQGQERDAAMSGLSEARSNEQANRESTQHAHKLLFIEQNPMLFMQQKGPLPPHLKVLRDQAKLLYPDLFPDQPTQPVDPRILASLK